MTIKFPYSLFVYSFLKYKNPIILILQLPFIRRCRLTRSRVSSFLIIYYAKRQLKNGDAQHLLRIKFEFFSNNDSSTSFDDTFLSSKPKKIDSTLLTRKNLHTTCFVSSAVTETNFDSPNLPEGRNMIKNGSYKIRKIFMNMIRRFLFVVDGLF